MIEKAIVTYLNNHPSLIAYKGKIFYHRVPTGITMPWAYATNSGGGRKKITQFLKEPFDTIQVYVESDKQFAGYDMAYAINAALDDYRGPMGNERDLVVRCDTIRDLDGFFQTFRYMLTVHVKYLQDVVANQH